MSARARVLVVDDDLATRVRLRDLLEREGAFEVAEAADGPAALAAVTEATPDLVLLDVMMPGMTGLEVCTRLRQTAEAREVPVIVLSAADEADAMLAALDAGADDFLRKPFWAPELRAKVRNIVRLNRFRALCQERDRFRWLVDHSREPVLIADARGTVGYANSAARELLGLHDAIGEDVASSIGRHFRCDPPGALAAWRELRWPLDRTFLIYQPESEQTPARWFEVELQALESAGETLLKFSNRAGAIRRELETFTFQHLISHKIRTPLNGLAPIFAYLDAMQTAKVDPEVRSLLDFARTSATRLESTLCGVLRYHAAVFQRVATPEGLDTPVPLADLVAEAADAAGVSGRVTHDELPARLRHHELVEIVVTELLDNYGKFSVEGSLIQVSWQPVGEAGEIRICAAGPRLAPDVLARLGRPYWQLERAFTGEVPGVGLGLATVRELLRWRGGELRLEYNETIGGLETRVVLPAEFLK